MEEKIVQNNSSIRCKYALYLLYSYVASEGIRKDTRGLRNQYISMDSILDTVQKNILKVTNLLNKEKSFKEMVMITSKISSDEDKYTLTVSAICNDAEVSDFSSISAKDILSQVDIGNSQNPLQVSGSLMQTKGSINTYISRYLYSNMFRISQSSIKDLDQLIPEDFGSIEQKETILENNNEKKDVDAKKSTDSIYNL